MKTRSVKRLVYAAFFSSVVTAVEGASAGVDRAQPAYSPVELHRLEAQSKSAGLARRGLVRPAYIVVQEGFDAVYYRLDIQVDDPAQQIAGRMTMAAHPQANGFTSPTLNLTSSLIVDSVLSFGLPLTWIHLGDFLYITLDSTYDLGEEFEITVVYHGHPPGGGLMAFAFSTHNGVPIISTLSEPYMAQTWWPCKDTPSDKADSVDVHVRVRDLFYAVSNGVLRDSVNHGDGTITYSWHEGYPITTYLVSLAITNYARFDRWYHHGPGDADSMPVRFYSYPEKLTTAQTSWPIAVDQIDFMAGKFGEYPFLDEKYGIAHFTFGGAMEHQTASSHTSGAFGFDQYLTVHELSHQWWGDMITCRDWHHIWLNEGFASYCEALWAEHLGGTPAYRSYMAAMAYLSGGRIYIGDTTDVWNIFSSRVYDKGAWVLHMLRGILGDAVFFDVLRTYYSHPGCQYKDAVTEDFRDIAESVSGVDLDEFFNDWIYGYYYPRYVSSWFAEPVGGGSYDIYVHLRQAQMTTPQVFDLPVEMQILGASGSMIVRDWNTARDQDYRFTVSFAPVGLTVDPRNWILDAASAETYGIHIINNSLTTGGQYTPYRDSIFAKGGAGAYTYTYAIIAGALPTGLTLDPATGIVSGLVTDSGSGTVTLSADWGPGQAYVEKTIGFTTTGAVYMPGDQNGDRVLDVLDITGLVDHVFRNADPPAPPAAADPNADCRADVLDVVALVNYVFRGGPFPLFGCLI